MPFSFSRYGNEVDGCLEGHGRLVFKDGHVYEVSNDCFVENNYMSPCSLDGAVLGPNVQTSTHSGVFVAGGGGGGAAGGAAGGGAGDEILYVLTYVQ